MPALLLRTGSRIDDSAAMTRAFKRMRRCPQGASIHVPPHAGIVEQLERDRENECKVTQVKTTLLSNSKSCISIQLHVYGNNSVQPG